MNETEAEILYKLLRDGLRLQARADEVAVGFPLAIEQEIAGGKQVRVHLSVTSEQRIDDPLAGGRTTSSRSRAQFVQQRDFTSPEKVAITLEGIALARIAPAQMANKIFMRIRELSPDTEPTLCFAHDHSVAGIRKISTDDVEAALPATQRLALALDEIRVELDRDALLLPDVL